MKAFAFIRLQLKTSFKRQMIKAVFSEAVGDSQEGAKKVQLKREMYSQRTIQLALIRIC